MMSDALRVAWRDGDFASACEVWLVETSPPLREVQAEAVPGAFWAAALDGVPGGAPTIILANEYLDCLPIRQAVAREGGWRERRVGLANDEILAIVEGPMLGDFSPPPSAGRDEIWEWSRALVLFGATVGERLAKDGGAALFIDYGRDAPGPGDTLQALRGHEKQHPLDAPGLADLTAHVDFPAFASAARRAGAEVSAIETQGDFLTRLGIDQRAEALIRASPGKRGVVERQRQRLTSADAMGALFKVAALTSPGLAPP